MVSQFAILIALDEREVTSSSVYQDNRELFDPKYAIDNRYWDDFPDEAIADEVKLFRSKTEDYPWIEWKLSSLTPVKGVNLNFGSSIRDIEIRAGNLTVGPSFVGKIDINIICDFFKGPSEAREDYSLFCGDTILAKYVTIQILDDKANLDIIEMKIESGPKGRILITKLFLALTFNDVVAKCGGDPNTTFYHMI